MPQNGAFCPRCIFFTVSHLISVRGVRSFSEAPFFISVEEKTGRKATQFLLSRFFYAVLNLLRDLSRRVWDLKTGMKRSVLDYCFTKISRKLRFRCRLLLFLLLRVSGLRPHSTQNPLLIDF